MSTSYSIYGLRFRISHLDQQFRIVFGKYFLVKGNSLKIIGSLASLSVITSLQTNTSTSLTF